LGLFAELFAGREIVIDGLGESSPEAANGIGVKTDAVANAGNPSKEDAVLVVEVDTGRIASVGHGVHRQAPALPMRIRKSPAAWLLRARQLSCKPSDQTLPPH
jgi:hypothetical protein